MSSQEVGCAVNPSAKSDIPRASRLGKGEAQDITVCAPNLVPMRSKKEAGRVAEERKCPDGMHEVRRDTEAVSEERRVLWQRTDEAIVQVIRGLQLVTNGVRTLWDIVQEGGKIEVTEQQETSIDLAIRGLVSLASDMGYEEIGDGEEEE